MTLLSGPHMKINCIRNHNEQYDSTQFKISVKKQNKPFLLLKIIFACRSSVHYYTLRLV